MYSCCLLSPSARCGCCAPSSTPRTNAVASDLVALSAPATSCSSTAYLPWLVVASEAACSCLLRRGRKRARLAPFLLTSRGWAAGRVSPWGSPIAARGQHAALLARHRVVERPAPLSLAVSSRCPWPFTSDERPPGLHYASRRPGATVVRGHLLLLWRNGERARAGTGRAGALCFGCCLLLSARSCRVRPDWALPPPIWGTRPVIVSPRLSRHGRRSVRATAPRLGARRGARRAGCWVSGRARALVGARPRRLVRVVGSAAANRRPSRGRRRRRERLRFRDLRRVPLWFALRAATGAPRSVAKAFRPWEDPPYFCRAPSTASAFGRRLALEGQRALCGLRAAAWARPKRAKTMF